MTAETAEYTAVSHCVPAGGAGERRGGLPARDVLRWPPPHTEEGQDGVQEPSQAPHIQRHLVSLSTARDASASRDVLLTSSLLSVGRTRAPSRGR